MQKKKKKEKKRKKKNKLTFSRFINETLTEPYQDYVTQSRK